MRLHRQVLARAKRAADACHGQADLLRRQPEAVRELIPVDVQPLRGDVEIHAALAIRDRKARFGAERRLVLHADLVLAVHDHVRARVLVASADPDPPRDVAVGMKSRCVIREGLLGVGQRFQDLVLDMHRLRRAPSMLRMVGRHQCDRFAPVTHHVHRQHRLVGDLEPVHLASGHVLMCEHRLHAGHRTRLARIDGNDASVRMRAAHRGAPQHACDLQVGRIRKIATRLEAGVGALDRFADAAAHLHGRRKPRLRGHFEAIRSAARCTASRILA